MRERLEELGWWTQAHSLKNRDRTVEVPDSKLRKE